MALSPYYAYKIACGCTQMVQSAMHKHDILDRQFEKLFMTDQRSACVFCIDLRVSRAEIDVCVSSWRACALLPDLPIQSYIQANDTVELSCLSLLLNATWEPVGYKLIPYAHFYRRLPQIQPYYQARFVYFPVHGVPALGKGGRPPKAAPPIYSSSLKA